MGKFEISKDGIISTFLSQFHMAESRRNTLIWLHCDRTTNGCIFTCRLGISCLLCSSLLISSLFLKCPLALSFCLFFRFVSYKCIVYMHILSISYTLNDVQTFLLLCSIITNFSKHVLKMHCNRIVVQDVSVLRVATIKPWPAYVLLREEQSSWARICTYIPPQK